MGVLYDNHDLKRKYSFLNFFFHLVKARTTDQKEDCISQFSGTTDSLTGKTETRGNLKFTYS